MTAAACTPVAVSKASLDLSGETVLEYMLTLWRGH